MKPRHKIEALIAESDAARQLYFLAREVEHAYRLIYRDLRHKELSAEEILGRDRAWQRISASVNRMEKEIEEEIEKLLNM